MQIRKQYIPWMMAAGRALLGPVLIAGERCGWNGVALAALIVAALVSDIFDGVLARRWNCDTAGVRLFDSMADTVFYVCVVAALWMGQPALWTAWRGPMMALVMLEAVRIGFDMLKFGKPASYHSYLAKMWGLVLAAAVVSVFATGHATVLMTLVVGLGVACNVEGIAMSVVLPEWRKDVKTLAVAWRMRREMRPSRGVGMKAAALMVVLLLAVPAFAMEPGEARYTGGTISGMARDAEGKLDLTNPESLIFTPANHGSIEIPYDHIREFKQHTEVTHPLGILATIVVHLLVARQHTYTFSIGYRDATGAVQLMTLEVPQSDVTVVSEVLQKRTSVVR